ncbi:MAG: DNA polymerase III subunit delta' [Epsilonproteobacteria bacterium]|nr:DNA polymerase III subunit delta' [Campylobacterota bacterium]
MILQSGVIVTNSPQKTLESLISIKKDESFTIIDTDGKEFLVEHASEAIAKAFVASDIKEYIILIAPRFSTIAQNRLLKIIEEPPRNKHFILITESKSSILPTIKSRLPIFVSNDEQKEDSLELDIENFNLAKAYEFIQANSRLSATECRVVIENIVKKAIKSKRYKLDESILELFSNSIKALEVGSPTQFVLTTVLLKLLAKKRKQ